MAIHEPAKRLLIIGIDGGTWDIFDLLCEYGEMPNLARLKAQGANATLRSTQPPFTAPAWSTFATGLNPGKHGVLQFVQRSENPVDLIQHQGQPVNSTQIRAATLWEYLEAAGKSIGQINFPLSYPLRATGGFAVSGMLTPPGAQDWTIPAELAAELQGYIIELEYGRPGKPLRADDLPFPREMLVDITHMTERRGFHALRQMQKRPWDVFGVVFTGTDRIFHHFWHYLQPGSSEASRNLDVLVSDQLQGYFRLLDSIIGSLARSVGSDGNIVVVSDHGFGPAAKHWAHLNNWLLELEFITLQDTTATLMQRMKRRAPWLRDVAKRILPPEAREAVNTFGNLAQAIDWPHTLAWTQPIYNNVAGVIFNRADRFPGGPVSPGAAARLRQTLIREAAKLRLPGTSKPLVVDIKEREELYRGPYTANFPDLILTLDLDHAAVPTLGSSLISRIPELLRSGDHRTEGIFLAHGPNILPGELEETPDLLDMAPTLLHLADAPIPRTMEGRPLTEILTEGYLVLHPPRTGPELQPPLETSLSPAETRAVADRLAGLGYIDPSPPEEE